MKVEAFQTSFAAGILGDRLQDREDLEAYFNGASDIVNLTPSPQGGLKLRGGTAFCGKHRGAVKAVDLTSATLTLSASGTGGTGGTAPADPPDDPFPYVDFSGWWTDGTFDFEGGF
ncbi:MAG: hypothetical protein AAFY82_00120 [Pseudomonadota bacterium]